MIMMMFHRMIQRLNAQIQKFFIVWNIRYSSLCIISFAVSQFVGVTSI